MPVEPILFRKEGFKRYSLPVINPLKLGSCESKGRQCPFLTARRMTSFTHIEKQKLERELGMSSGYVLNFSNRTFEEFFREVVGVEIYAPCFDLGSGSKANRMRAFWRIATNVQLRLLLKGLLEGWCRLAH